MESTSGQLVSSFGSQHAERVPRAVRAPRAEPRRQRSVGHRSGDQHPRHRQLRRPDCHRGRRRLRLHAGHLPGGQQLHLPSRQPQLQVRRRHPADRRQAHVDAAAAVHVPEHRRLPGGQERHQSAQLHELPAADRQPRLRDEVVGLQLLRAGRLARHAGPEVHLRPALRLLQLPGRRPQRAVPLLAGLCRRRQQLRSALRPRLHVRRRQAPGDSRQLRHHVRPDAARRLRDRHPGQRQPANAST